MSLPPGLDREAARLLAGFCTTWVLVRALPEDVAKVLGDAERGLRGGEAWVAALGTGGWSAVELARRADAPDYLAPLFEQALAALAGEVPDAPLSYEAAVTTAGTCARALGVDACALWGSEEWPGIAGGAFFEGGALLTTVSGYAPDAIEEAWAERRRWSRHDDQFPGLDAGWSDTCWRWTPEAEGEEDGALLEILDRELRARDAPEPPSPLDGWGQGWGVRTLP